MMAKIGEDGRIIKSKRCIKHHNIYYRQVALGHVYCVKKVGTSMQKFGMCKMASFQRRSQDFCLGGGQFSVIS